MEFRLAQPALTQVRIRQGPGVGGIGLFAAGVIQRGAIILNEAPLFSLSHSFADGDLATRLNLLNQADRDAFHNLHPQNGTDRQIFESNRFEMCEGPVEPDRIHNNGLFLQASRFNHSCISNAHMDWNEATQRVTVYAIREINKDSEIFVNYVAEHFSVRAQRQRALADYGFTCSCKACQGNTRFGKESDTRRRSMDELNSLIANVATNAGTSVVPRTYVADVRALLQDFDLERLVFPGVAELWIKSSKWFGQEFEEVINSAVDCQSLSVWDLEASAVRDARRGLGYALMTTGPDSKVTKDALDAIEKAKILLETGRTQQWFRVD